ncbi:hypothetical protein ACH5RR_001366 [Cinchona calisaya]|uniref:Protein FAR1-RELATED SEQUENCE n=1 Tax=Cinchona calisaya TaxID=153742 RepID=A0ABD3B3A5_9GENT
MGEAKGAIGYLSAKKDSNSMFYYKYCTDGDGRLHNLFWADFYSRRDYSRFGDVLVFDTMYRTNDYRKSLDVLAGVNNHYNSIIFSCGQLLDESFKTYKWENLIDEFELQNNDWVGMVYRERRCWAEAYCRGQFFASMRNTQRSEKMNGFLNKYLHDKMHLYEFVKSFDLTIAWLRHNEVGAIHQTMDTSPIMSIEIVLLEWHASKIFTRNVFYRILWDFNIHNKEEYIESQLGWVPPFFSGGSIRVTEFLKSFIGRAIDPANEISVACIIQAFFLYTLGCKIFSNTGDTIHLCCLQVLEEVHNIRSYNWDGAAIAQL